MNTVEERIWYTKYIRQKLASTRKVTDTEQVSQGTIEGQEDEAIGQIGINMSTLGGSRSKPDPLAKRTSASNSPPHGRSLIQSRCHRGQSKGR
jgi:hypothetical protein